MLSKNAKALLIVNVRAAELQAENTRLKHLLEQAQPSQPRKRVKIDQNQRFAEVKDIIAAIN